MESKRIEDKLDRAVEAAKTCARRDVAGTTARCSQLPTVRQARVRATPVERAPIE